MNDSKRQRKVNYNITEGSLRSSFWKLSIPMMAGALFHNLFSLVDLFFIGRLGYIAVAALSVAGVILSMVIMIAIGLSTGTTALIAHYTGKRDYVSADNVLFQTVVLSVVCSVILAAIGLFCTAPILRVFGTSSEVIPLATVYLKIIFSCSIAMFIFLSFSQALRGSGDAIVPLKILILANAINIVLDPLFIFGISFFPRMGVAGSAVATVISQVVGVVFLIRHLAIGKSSLHFHHGIMRVNPLVMGRIMRIGFFSSLEILLRQLSLLLLIRLISSFGVAALASYGIVIRLRMFVMMLGFGMGGAAAVLIGQNMGAQHFERATHSGWKALKYYEITVVPMAILFFIFSSPIVGIFNNHLEVVAIGSSFLRFIAFTLPFLAMALILGRGITGAGDTVAPAIMTGIAQIGLLIPVAYCMALVFHFGIAGIWLGINASDIVQGAMMIWYFKRGYWQKRYHKHRAILEQETVVMA